MVGHLLVWFGFWLWAHLQLGCLLLVFTSFQNDLQLQIDSEAKPSEDGLTECTSPWESCAPWVTEVHCRVLCRNCARCLRPFTGLEKLSALILNLAFLHYKGLSFPPTRGIGWKFSFLTEAFPSPLHPASSSAQSASLTTLWASGGHFC